MAHLEELYNINEITKVDALRCFLRSLSVEKYIAGKIYHKGDIIVYVVDKGLVMLRCTVDDSSEILVTDEWEEYSVTTRLEEMLVINDSRHIFEDTLGLEAGTDINGMNLKQLISNLIFKQHEPQFFHDQDIYLDMDNGPRTNVNIDVHYKESSNPIEKLEVIYKDNVINTLYGAENIANVVLDIDDSDSPNQIIYYKAYYSDGRIPSTGVLAKVLYVYPTYVGLININEFDVSNMQKLYVAPNSTLSCVKNDSELNSLAVIVQEESWRQISGCFLEDNTNIMNAILSTEKYIDGYLYKVFYTYPTMLTNIKLKFSFEDGE